VSTQSAGEDVIRKLYESLLDAWNQHSAESMAGLFAEDSNLIGFDGSQINGRAQIEAEMSRIFADHVTSAYIGKIREVRFLSPEVALLRAVSGMIPPGQSDLNPGVNTIQSLIAVRQNGEWRIALYQNTPAAFHGRPDLSEALTDELRTLLK
jgi:uncharacterized protein (TIGR02246 family)